MITTEPTMTHLFQQLGLDDSEHGIASFIKEHQLPTDVALGSAIYWNDGQRQFLSEQLKEDASWALVVDQLNEALHADAVRRSTGI